MENYIIIKLLATAFFFPSKELVGNKEVLLPHQEEEVEDEL